jgi:hypothetical protein
MERFADVHPVRLIDSRAAADSLRVAVAAYLALPGLPSRGRNRPLDLACRQDVITPGFPSLQTLVIMRCVNRQPSAVRRSRSS